MASSEWDDALTALGLSTPDQNAAGGVPFEISNPAGEVYPPAPGGSAAYNPVGALAGGLARVVTTPGVLANASNPYPPGSEEADWFDRQKSEAGQNWAGGMALGMLGGGTSFIGPSEATLAAAGANKLLGGLKAKYPETLSEQFGSFKPGEPASAASAASAPVDIWKADPKTLTPGTFVQAGSFGPIGKFQGVSPGGATLVDWKVKPEASSATAQAFSKILETSPREEPPHFDLHSSDPTEQALAQIEAALKGHSAVDVEGSLPTDPSDLSAWKPSSAPKSPTYGETNQLTDAAIAKSLASNPGASIFDLAGVSEHPSSPVKKSLGGYEPTTQFSSAQLGSFPKEVPYAPSEQALAQGYVTPALHGTRLGEHNWQTPESGLKLSDADASGKDALRLPPDELGVHFGTPEQAHHFTSTVVGGGYLPRTYPTVLQTGKSLELPDMGTWETNRIHMGLDRLHMGSGYNLDRGNYHVADPEAHIGEFPRSEREHIDSIEDMRDYLASKGYDSVNYINSVEGPGQRSYIMFKPSPAAPSFVSGVRSRFAKFDPSKLARPELAVGLAGAAASPLVFDQKNNPYILTK